MEALAGDIRARMQSSLDREVRSRPYVYFRPARQLGTPGERAEASV